MEHNTNTTPTRDQIIDIMNRPGCTWEDDADAILDLFNATPDDDCIRIPRADLPKVVEDRGGLRVDGATYLANFATPAERRRRARHYLALAEYLDAREAREAEAAKEAELTKRRGALATELGVMAFPDDSEEFLRKYELLSPIAQVAVNWLMEAQDRLAKYEEVQA